jgi:hypothetical protein
MLNIHHYQMDKMLTKNDEKKNQKDSTNAKNVESIFEIVLEI